MKTYIFWPEKHETLNSKNPLSSMKFSNETQARRWAAGLSEINHCRIFYSVEKGKKISIAGGVK